MTRPIEADWTTLVAEVVSPEASETQLIEMRRAFFAGATAVMTILSDSWGNEFSTLQTLNQELLDYSKSIEAGKS